MGVVLLDEDDVPMPVVLELVAPVPVLPLGDVVLGMLPVDDVDDDEFGVVESAGGVVADDELVAGGSGGAVVVLLLEVPDAGG